ncbi:hypothetical protein RINTHM_4060 [Richelia intracellularis HM01]|nr:hypothetical protein RINTHM_4060 [Richelia intracellularis HM01]
MIAVFLGTFRKISGKILAARQVSYRKPIHEIDLGHLLQT